MREKSSRELVAHLRELRDGSADLTPSQRQARRRLLTTAAQHFARFGYRKASVGAIADEAALGKGTVYLHFDSKKALLQGCIADEKLQMMPELEAVMLLEGSERLEGFLRAVVSFAMSAPLSGAILRGDGELAAVLDDIGPTELADDLADRGRLMIELIRSVNPEMEPSETAALAEVVMLASLLPVYLPMAAVRLPIEHFADGYARLLTRGVQASGSTSTPTSHRTPHPTPAGTAGSE